MQNTANSFQNISIEYDTQYVATAAGGTYNGTNARDWLQGGAGSDKLFGGAGDDYIIAGTGYDWFVRGGTGADIFQFGLGDQGVKIADWEAGLDKIALTDGLSFEDLSIASQLAGSTQLVILTTDQGDRLILQGVTEDDVSAADFTSSANPIEVKAPATSTVDDQAETPSQEMPVPPVSLPISQPTLPTEMPKLQIVVTMGQSLAQGVSFPNRELFSKQSIDPSRILTVDMSDDLRLAKGPGSLAVNISDFKGLIPLNEQIHETHSTSMMNRIVEEYDVAGLTSPTMLHLNVAISGSSIIRLSTPDENVFSDITTAKSATGSGELFAIETNGTYTYYGNDNGTALKLGIHDAPAAFSNYEKLLRLAYSEAENLNYDVEGKLLINWIQGQADNNGNAEKFGYEQLLGNLFKNVDDVADDVYGIDVETIALISQHRGYGSKSVATAQTSFIVNNDFAHFGAPEYQFEASEPANPRVDLTHLTSEGYYMLGQTLGQKAFHALNGTADAAILIDMVQALSPTELLVTFSGLEGTLVDDPGVYRAGTGLVAPSHLGFGLYAENGGKPSNFPEIIGADLVGADQVKLLLDAPLTQIARVYLGRNDEDLSDPMFPTTHAINFGGTTLRDSEVFSVSTPQNGRMLDDPIIYEFAPIQSYFFDPLEG